MTARDILDERKKKKQKEGAGLTILARREAEVYSQALSHYRPTRGLLPAPCRAWAGMILIIQPGRSGLLRIAHIDAEPSAGARST